MPASRPARFGLKPSRWCYLCAAALLALTLSWPAFAMDTAICDRAAQTAARRHGVPLDVLRAVTRLETGRKQGGVFRPWPWALNAGGKGYWLDSKADAAATARTILASGRRNLDLGCFQVNYHWHGQHFANIDDMLDPALNADYAARYLLSHFRRLGDWKAAVGAYHSRTPEYAQRYLARYDMIAQNLGPQLGAETAPASPPTPKRNQNGYALLTGTGGGTRGSLVPASALAGSGPLLSAGGRSR